MNEQTNKQTNKRMKTVVNVAAHARTHPPFCAGITRITSIFAECKILVIAFTKLAKSLYKLKDKEPDDCANKFF